MPSPPILLVDDDESFAMLLEDSLRREGYDPRWCGDVAHAEQELRNRAFDVILLDVTLPDRSGFEFCAALRNQGIQTPVLMLTARGEVTDRVTGLRIGADDYLPKPFDVPELLARIEALRRRSCPAGRPDAGLFEFGDVCVNFYTRSVSRAGRPVDLSRREFEMLSHLIRNRGRVVLRDELLRAVWDTEPCRIPARSMSTCGSYAASWKPIRRRPASCEPFTEAAICSPTVRITFFSRPLKDRPAQSDMLIKVPIRRRFRPAAERIQERR